MKSTQANSEWITVAVASQPQEAYMLKAVLEAEGISVFLKDEMTAMTYCNAMGGIQVQVPDSEAERAHLLLVEGEYIV